MGSLWLLLWLGHAMGGPVPAQELDAQLGKATTEEALPMPAPPMSGQGLAVGGPAPARVLGSTRPSEQAPSPSALAAEIIKEAEAGATSSVQGGAEVRRRTQAANAQAARPQPTADPALKSSQPEAADAWGMRETAKAAVSWLKETLPWLRRDPADGSAGKDAASSGWSGSPLDSDDPARHGAAGRSHGVVAVQRPDTPGPKLYGASGRYDEKAVRGAAGSEANVLSDLIEVVRQILGHPMTWLVISLFVIGGIVMSKADRRPK